VFRIKQRNVDAFVAHEEREFEGRVVQRLRDNFDGMRGKGDEELRAFVRLGRERAARYDIRSPYGISLFVGIMAEIGEDFDESGAYPWATELLHNPNLSGNARVECVCDQALEIKAAARATAQGEG